MRWVHSPGNIEERINFTPALVSRKHPIVCIAIAAVSNEIRNFDVNLAVKDIFIGLIGKSSDSNSSAVTS